MLWQSPPLLQSQSLVMPLLVLTSTLVVIPVLQGTSSPGPGVGVQILRAPQSIVAPSGDEVIFECETSLPPESFEWSFRHVSFQSHSSSPGFKYLKPASGKFDPGLYNISVEQATSKLRVFVQPETLGEYRCMVWFGPLAVTSTTARLNMTSIALPRGNSPSLEPNTLHWIISAGNPLILPCEQVVSNPPAAWTFYRNSIEIRSVKNFSNGSLLLPALTKEHSGTYTCAASNTVSGVKIMLPRKVELDVISSHGEREAPHRLAGQSISTELEVREGDSVVLLCPGVGTPKPTMLWSKENVPNALQSNRTTQLPYGLEIVSVQPQDAGTYICYLDNGIQPVLKQTIKLRVQQPVQIIRSPHADLTNESEQIQLECQATGVPAPEIYWLLNGSPSVYDSEARVLQNGYLLLRSVQKRHAGYVQCFARNTLGEQSAGTLLQVNPKQIQTESRHSQGNRPMKTSHGLREQAQMQAPTAPNVTRLSDESVMLRWHVPRNDGLPILFFKVQYRMFADGDKRKYWQTTNENISYGKPKWNSAQGKNFTASVSNLKPQHSYRFRIMAVYSNNDNKESKTSAKFFLQQGATLDPLPVPELLDIEQHSETAVLLHWRLGSNADEELISGYYAYYRPSSSAGEYFKATIEGAQTRSFQISPLEAGTFYEFKLQSFSAVSASEFSELRQGRTLKPKTTTSEQPPLYAVDTTTPSHNETFSMKPLLGTIGGATLLLLLLLLGAYLCVCRRRSAMRANVMNKPRIAEDFVALGKTRPSQRHIHITLNPLAQHEEKGSSSVAQDNELAFFQRQSNYGDADPHGYNGLSLRRVGVPAGANNNNLNQSPGENGNMLPPPADSPRLQPSNKSGLVLLKRTRLSSRSDNISSGSLNSVGV